MKPGNRRTGDCGAGNVHCSWVVASLLLNACVGQEATMTDRSKVPEEVPVTAEERRREEQQTIEQVLAGVAEKDRVVVRRELEQYFASIPEVSRTSVAQMRAATGEKGVTRRPAPYVRVRVALVPTLGAANLKAAVIRRPGDHGEPLLLLREGDATDEDLRGGLRAAEVAARRFGEEPAREWRLSFRSTDRTRPLPPLPLGVRSNLELLRGAPFQEVPGAGMVRTMIIGTRRKIP